MNKKIGRNDPCPCGSGKKYKKCCFNTTDVIDLRWRRLRQLEGKVIDQYLLPYVTKELPDSVMEFALVDSFPETLPDTFDRELLFNNFFIPWFLFNWIPEEDFGLDLNQFNPEITIAQNYHRIHKDELNREEGHFFDLMNQSYYSFYAVLQVELNKTLLIKDILLGLTHAIKEKQGTHKASKQTYWILLLLSGT